MNHFIAVSVLCAGNKGKKMKIQHREYQDLMLEVCSAADITVFLDTNVILAQGMRKLWADRIGDIVITWGVVSEIRKRPEEDEANRFVDRCIDLKRVLSREGCPFPHALDFVTCCAKRIPRVVEEALRDHIEKNGEPTDLPGKQKMINVVLQKVVNDDPTLFGIPEYRKDMVGRGLLPHECSEVNSSTIKSWFGYLQKRLKKKDVGEYFYTDERLAAIAATNAILAERGSVIVSLDRDYQAIFKQLTDNLLTNFSRDGSGGIDEETFQNLVNGIEQLRQQRELYSIREIVRTNGDISTMYPKSDEVLVFNPRARHSCQYAFGRNLNRLLWQAELQIRGDESAASIVERVALANE